ncbi:MAG: Fe-S-containing hydro-lyase [Bacillota bacterium]
MEQRITFPINEATARGLRAGDTVRVNGVIYTGRDAAHMRLVELLKEGKPLPIDLNGQAIYYVGPSPAPPGRPVGSAGPTTSGRMDVYTPPLLALGLRAMIGKGSRHPEVVEAMRRHGAVYLVCVGGAAALLARSITASEVVAFPDLGPEAIHRFTVSDFPTIVAIDSEGEDYYARGVAEYRSQVRAGRG